MGGGHRRREDDPSPSPKGGPPGGNGFSCPCPHHANMLTPPPHKRTCPRPRWCLRLRLWTLSVSPAGSGPGSGPAAGTLAPGGAVPTLDGSSAHWQLRPGRSAGGVAALPRTKMGKVGMWRPDTLARQRRKQRRERGRKEAGRKQAGRKEEKVAGALSASQHPGTIRRDVPSSEPPGQEPSLP